MFMPLSDDFLRISLYYHVIFSFLQDLNRLCLTYYLRVAGDNVLNTEH